MHSRLVSLGTVLPLDHYGTAWLQFRAMWHGPLLRVPVSVGTLG